ncbi:MAG: hypothetical protein PHN82_01895 [bacterium]|nr:hypothetical protein [bacterium]
MRRWMLAGAAALFAAACAGAGGGEMAEPGDGAAAGRARVGGPCEYDDYPGTAVITRIIRTPRSRAQAAAKGGAGYEGVEVWFAFTPDGEIAEDWARKAAGREQLFQLANSWYPGERYLLKYGIEPEKSFRCVYRVIRKGTCTPALFEFTDPRQDDYFESLPEE